MTRLDTCSRRWILGLLATLAALPAAAQVLPMGGHYGGRPSDTGHDPGTVTGLGTYAAAVPLDLPASRGGIPVPLQIATTGRSVGAAGLGWDIPLSFIRRDTTYARRRPKVDPDAVPAGREQVTLTLQGRTLDLVPRGAGTGDWVARYDNPTYLFHEQAGAWSLYDGDGQTFTFTAPGLLAGTNLWILTSISGPGGKLVQLDYDVLPQTVPGGSGISIDLVHVSYNSHPTMSCFKNEVALVYNPPAGVLAMTVLGDKVLTRTRTLATVDVLARASCTTAPERLRGYELEYLPDPDTLLPQLHAVNLRGRQGTREQDVVLPVARYGYGSAVKAGKLQYTKTQTVTFPTGPDTSEIASTRLDGVASPPLPSGLPYATWQSLTDVTGDGRPDLVFKKDNALWVALNRPLVGGNTSLTQPATTVPLGDATLTAGAFEERSATRNRFNYSGNWVNTDQVWRQAIDVNGDGRVDLIDAAESAGEWVVYLNTPDPTAASGVKWIRRSYRLLPVYNALWARGHAVNSNYIPLSNRYTGRDRTVGACWQWNGTDWVWYQAGFTNGACAQYPNAALSTGPEKTYTEWELTDVNGDGFPDLVFNSSPVEEVQAGPPSWDGSFTGEVAHFQMQIWMKPRAGDANAVLALFNVGGLFLDTGTNPFSSPVSLTGGECGVALWTSSGYFQSAVCELADVNGDGLVDRVVDTVAALGTGKGFLPVTLTLPGRLATQRSGQTQACVDPDPVPPGSTTFGTTQYAGLRDLTGDGIPDFAELYIGEWRVWVGTGSGFAQPVPIEVVGSGFSLSGEVEQCDGKVSSTTGGLFDIDGDGKPDVVHMSSGGLNVYQLSGGVAVRNPEAGRLNVVENGHGARTLVGYRSAKEDPYTAHQVPFPEIVVTSVQTVGTLGFGGSVLPTLYAYGGAQLYFDTSLQAWLMGNYQRTVQQQLISGAENKWDSRVTITDTWPLPAFAATPKNERFGRYLKVGKLRDVTTLRVAASADPWALVSVNVLSDLRRIGGTHYEWATRLIEEPAIPGTTTLDCLEMMFPYSFIDSWANNPGWYDTCSAHGFVYGLSSESWRGASAPPSSGNVNTRSETRSVDDYGRLTSVSHLKDLHRSDDDVCEDTTFATPTNTGTGPRILSAPATHKLWDCGREGTAVYHSEQWTYDGLAQGSVSNGFASSHTVDRRDSPTGLLMASIRGYDALTDAAGNPYQVTRVRNDGATQTLSLDYDPWGLALTHERVDATGAATIEATSSLDPVSLEVLATIGNNQTAWKTEYDGFGRRTRSTVTPPGKSPGVLSTLTYLGDGENDPDGRRVVSQGFTTLPKPGTEATAPSRVGVLFLDELGRQRKVEQELGADYGKEALVVGARTYDGIGRVLFEADPYPRSQPFATAYGTTSYFNIDGTPSCTVRGPGLQPYTNVGNESAEILPTCYSRSYDAWQETLNVRDPASSIAGSPQQGVVKSVVLTAVGRVVSRSTLQGTTRLEHATFTHDRMGHLTGMTRYLDPATATPNQPVTWGWRYDSFGQLTGWQEPEAAPITNTFSSWGELVSVKWADSVSGVTRERLTTFDGLGRVTHAEARNNGVIDSDTVNDYLYDTGSSPTSLVKPTFVAGRLARLKAPTGDVYFSYDALGRPDTRTFTDTKGTVYVERSSFDAAGALDTLTLYLPDNALRPEVAQYAYDTAHRLRNIGFADGTTSQDLYAAELIDPLGRVLKARYGTGGVLAYAATYAPAGRGLLQDELYDNGVNSRLFRHLGYDAVGREWATQDLVDGATTGLRTSSYYDALGRLSGSLQTTGSTTQAWWSYGYDPLGNLTNLLDQVGTADAALSYRAVDRDRICRIGYGNGGLGGTACNVAYDGLGNITSQPTRTGTRTLSYFADGRVATLTEGGVKATFRYGAADTVEEMDLQGPGALDARHDWRFGGLIERRDALIAGKSTSVITRQIPGPTGLTASRRGAGKDWVFRFGDTRGTRLTADATGKFIQEVTYSPFGEARSTGAAPGNLLYTSAQWNGGEALATFNVAHLGARLYDPVIGRFVSRDPLRVPRTSATSNPYAFALNDPTNLSDPTGMDVGASCYGIECTGPVGSGPSVPYGGPSLTNPLGLYLPGPVDINDLDLSDGRPQPGPTATWRPLNAAPQTAAGRALQQKLEARSGVKMGSNFNYDTLAATGISVEDALNVIAETPEANAQVEEYNATLDRYGSWSAGLGDAVWWWCPGCGHYTRQSWNIKSGDANTWWYLWGSATGIFGSIAIPHPTSVSRPPKADVERQLRESLMDVNPTMCRTNCGLTAVATDSTLAGRPMQAAWARSGTNPGALEAYFQSTFAQARGARGLTKMVESWGPGSRGVVIGYRSGEEVGHAFNVVNRDGMVFFVDGQRWYTRVNLKNWDEFWLMRTN